MLKRLRTLIAPSAAKLPVVEQRAAVLAGTQVTYTLKRSAKRRSISLRIDDRGLTVSMPLRASERWLHDVLQDRASWVVEKLAGWQSRQPEVMNWADGETIPYLGELLTLRVVQSLFAAPAQQHDEDLRVFVQDETNAAQIEKKVTAWYRHQAHALFAGRVAHFAPGLNVAPAAIKLSVAKTRWGSCTSRGVVRLNLQLIKLPGYLLDYVVVHELSHLREMNHSAAFWQVVASACPNYAILRRELKTFAL
jgi:predicted metal-dependent hydrolase